jgi:uncharacterized protein
MEEKSNNRKRSRLPAALCLAAFALSGLARADINAAQDAYNKKDYATAFKEFEAMAEQGHALAQSSLGVLYDNGQGVARDYDKAIYWYRKSADQNNAHGQFNLGTMYYMGTGVAKDPVEACKWWSLATRQGDGQARIHMRLCMTHLTEPQRDDFNQRVRDWLVGHNLPQ